ncbi:helix-turn-helix domain-containing protein [Streptomyces sp. NPDC059743]|uniref:helix-turn-helix domain-containing protein n=1 Tax=Streptomyces sp. NPDC059743 TaxID=3346928 RepID=UPI00364633FD
MQEKPELGLPFVPKHARLTGKHRLLFATAVGKAYEEKGASIREIADESGRSYGAIHRLLTWHKVEL